MKLTAQGIKKDFPRASKSSNYFTAVQPMDFELTSGQMIEVTGRSGSGKSTLLNMLAGMLTPTSGKVLLDDTDLYALDEKALSRLRNEKIGLIPQGHTALLSLTVLENVLLPAVLYSKTYPDYRPYLVTWHYASLADQSAAPFARLLGERGDAESQHQNKNECQNFLHRGIPPCLFTPATAGSNPSITPSRR